MKDFSFTCKGILTKYGKKNIGGLVKEISKNTETFTIQFHYDEKRNWYGPPSVYSSDGTCKPVGKPIPFECAAYPKTKEGLKKYNDLYCPRVEKSYNAENERLREQLQSKRSNKNAEIFQSNRNLLNSRRRLLSKVKGRGKMGGC